MTSLSLHPLLQSEVIKKLSFAREELYFFVWADLLVKSALRSMGEMCFGSARYQLQLNSIGTKGEEAEQFSRT